jgi:hypothetical protein
MDLKNFFFTFEHYDIVAIALFVFVLIASGFTKNAGAQLSKEIHTAKQYPDIRHIYIKYFRVRSGFNLMGVVTRNEPLYVVNSPFVWDYKIEWPQQLLKFSFAGLGIILGIVIMALFFTHKDIIDQKLMTAVVLLAILTSALIVLLQKKLQNTIRKNLIEFNKEIDIFLQSRSISRSDIALPVNYQYGSGSLKFSFLMALAIGIILPAILILVIQE